MSPALITLQSAAIAIGVALGVGCLGIGAICILASDRIDEVDQADRTIGVGIGAAIIGALLLAAAYGAAWL